MTDIGLHLEVGNLDLFNDKVKKAGVKTPEELNMRGQYPTTQTEMIAHAQFHGLRVIEDTTLPKDAVVMKDSHGHIVRQFRI